MIQRIQSLFLLVVAIAMITSIFLPVWQKENPKTEEVATLSYITLKYTKAKETVKSQTTIYMALLAGVAAGLAIYSIFSYRNRLFQMKLGMFNSLVMAALMGLSVYLSTEAETLFKEPINGEYLFAFYLVIVALISNLIANRFIRRDERLVRSANRMR